MFHGKYDARIRLHRSAGTRYPIVFTQLRTKDGCTFFLELL